MALVLDETNSLITLEDLKEYLADLATDELVTGGERNEELEHIINAVSGYCNTRTHRKLKTRENTEYYDGDGTDVLFVDNYPITSTAATISIWNDVDRDYGDNEKIDAEDIIIYADDGIIKLEEDVFSKGYQSVKITYTAGYTLTAGETHTIPGDLSMAVKMMCAKLWSLKQDKTFVASSINAGNASASFFERWIPPFADEVLKRYEREVA